MPWQGTHNNLIERLLRPVAVGRKNYLFFGSEKGGQTAATLYTLVQSARRNCVDVWPYLTDMLRRLPAIPPTDTAALETLLPDRWLQVHPEHRLTEREQESREAQAVADRHHRAVFPHHPPGRPQVAHVAVGERALHAAVRSASPQGNRISPAFLPSTYTAAKELTYFAQRTIRRPVHCRGTVISRWYQATVMPPRSSSLQLG